jgi:hypothetical protein
MEGQVSAPAAAFGRVHETVRVTPAHGGGVTDRVWIVEVIVARINDQR